MNIVRKRCIDFILALKKYGYANEIPLESAKIIFSQNGFGFDRFTIKAYFGNQLRTQRKKDAENIPVCKRNGEF